MSRFVGEMTWKKFLPGYIASLVVGVGAAIWLEATYNVPARRSVLVIGAFFFAWAAIGRPRYVFLLVRNIGLFSAIENERSMRIVLWILVVALLGAGVIVV